MQLTLTPRPTSFMALREIRSQGLLGRMQLLVYEALVEFGPMTGMELEHRLASPGQVRGSAHKRLPELARMGLVEALPARTCRVTGHLAVDWKALDRLPEQPAPRPTRLEAFAADLVARLEREPGRSWTASELADLVQQMAGGAR